MNFNITFNLPISEANEALIPIVASMMGWDGVTGTAADFICEKVQSQIADIPQHIFFSAIDGYFGVAGKTQADAAKTDYSENAVCTVTLQ